MSRDYCTLEQVKRLLRTANKKIRTSEAYKELNYDQSNSGSVRLSSVSFLDSYSGHERFSATFSDSTSFEVSGEEIGYLGAGSTGVEFSCDYFTLASSSWSGTPENGDIVYFISDSDVSVDDANAFIDDACNYIRNRLGEVFGDSTNIPWEADLTVNVPGGLEFAAIRLAAYYIYTSALAGTIFDQEAPVEVSWHREAKEAIDAFLNWYKKEKQVGAPRWRSRDTLFDDLGIEGLENGKIDVTEDVEEDQTYRRN